MPEYSMTRRGMPLQFIDADSVIKLYTQVTKRASYIADTKTLEVGSIPVGSSFLAGRKDCLTSCKSGTHRRLPQAQI